MKRIGDFLAGVILTDIFYMGTLARNFACLIAGSAVFLFALALLGVLEYCGIGEEEEE